MDKQKVKKGVLSVEEIKKLVKKIYRPDETQQALLRKRQESTSGKKNYIFYEMRQQHIRLQLD